MLPQDKQKKLGRLPSCSPPKSVVFCDQKYFLQNLLSSLPHTVCDGCFSSLYFLKDHPGVAVGHFGIGAPTTASKMEELITWGVSQFVTIGTAGSLQTKAKRGDLVLCEKAIRDEQISHNYLPTAKYIHAPRRMSTKLQMQMKKMNIPFHIGSTWTTDNLYKQTDEEVEQYRIEGVLTVEREAAALFAVAHCYQVDLAALFTISDPAKDLLWQPHFDDPQVQQGLKTALDVAVLATIQ
ncbi:MAG: hypothetical protein RLZZ453_277 [Chlamydiota bacterium]|jgi:purine-nucleoside phosphorylase